MRSSALSPLSVVALALLVVLNVAIYLALFGNRISMQDKEASASPPWAAPAFDATARVEHKPIEAYVQILSRPVFWRSRLPIDQTPLPPQEAVGPANSVPGKERPTPPKFSLTAIALGQGKQRALLIGPSRPAAEWSKLGDVIEGWTIVAVEAESVMLEADGEKFRLALFPENIPRKGAHAGQLTARPPR